MKVNINITPYCIAIIDNWAARKNTTFDNIVNVLLTYAFENECINPPIKVSNASEVGYNTVHMEVDVWNEDYIAMVNNNGKRSIKISRILEYLVTYQTFDERYLDCVDFDIFTTNSKKPIKTTFNKFLEQEQTRLKGIDTANINLAKEIFAENFDTLWPIVKFANSRLNIKPEAAEYIEKVLSIKGAKHET